MQKNIKFEVCGNINISEAVWRGWFGFMLHFACDDLSNA